MKPSRPVNLDYAPPDQIRRTIGRMLVDAAIGLVMIVVGLIGGFIAVILTEAISFRRVSADEIPDRPFRWVADGVRRIVRGARPPTSGTGPARR